MWLDAFSFPLFLQKGQLLSWLIITGFLLFPVPFFLFRRKKQIKRIDMKAVEEEFPEEETSDKLKPEEYPQEYIEENLEEQIEEQIEEQFEEQTEELIEEHMTEAITCNQAFATLEDSALSFEELLELGFSAKESGRHQKAAEYFVLALKTRPAPDICYYLIMDSYWLWKSANLAELAIHELKPFIKNCLTEAPEDWQKRLREWLQENQIQLK